MHVVHCSALWVAGSANGSTMLAASLQGHQSSTAWSCRSCQQCRPALLAGTETGPISVTLSLWHSRGLARLVAAQRSSSTSRHYRHRVARAETVTCHGCPPQHCCSRCSRDGCCCLKHNIGYPRRIKVCKPNQPSRRLQALVRLTCWLLLGGCNLPTPPLHPGSTAN